MASGERSNLGIPSGQNGTANDRELSQSAEKADQPAQIMIRRALPSDANAIAEIYNQAIASGTSTFDAFEVSATRYAPFFHDTQGRMALIVATYSDKVVGWASVSPISERWAYRYTCLISTFIQRDFQHKGVGRMLKKAQIAAAEDLGYHSLVGEALSINRASISLNLESGFEIVGEIKEAGYRDGKWIGLVVLQRIIPTKTMLGGEPLKMRERQVVFSVFTDDLSRSISFYRDILRLKMRPLGTGAIAMFPLGTAEFQVCLRSQSMELVGVSPRAGPTNGLVISMEVDTREAMDGIFEAALREGATRTELQEISIAQQAFQDFNGVKWLLTVARPS